MLLTDKEYNLYLNMEDEKIRLRGILVFLLINDYYFDNVFQEKKQTLSNPFELHGILEYSGGYSENESESGKESTIDANIKISKKSVKKINKKISVGDIVRILNDDVYEDFNILSVTPYTPDGEYLNRVIGYDCTLQRISSRKPELIP